MSDNNQDVVTYSPAQAPSTSAQPERPAQINESDLIELEAMAGQPTPDGSVQYLDDDALPETGPVQETVAAALPATPNQEFTEPANHNLNDWDKLPTRSDKSALPSDDLIYLPSATNETIAANMRAAKQRERVATAHLEDWVQTAQAGQYMSSSEDVLARTLSRESSFWTNEIDTPSGPLRSSEMRLRVDPTRTYTGIHAELRLQQAAGSGVPWRCALWHSGIWVTFHTPPESDILELERRLVQEKNSIGYATYGLAYSNSTIYTQKTIVDFALRFINMHSVRLKEGESLLAHIKTQDYPLLVHGLARAIYPHGFNYKRSCIADPDNCNHIVKDVVDIGRMVAIDRLSLTQRQLNFMANQEKGGSSPEQLNDYQKEFLRGREVRVELTPEFVVFINMPNLDKQITYGLQWIAGIEEQYGQAMTLTEVERSNYLYAQANASKAREYGHYITKVIAQGVIYETPEELVTAANIISSTDTLRNKFIEAAKNFSADSTIALPAVPNFKCPNCHKFQISAERKHNRYPDLIAYDAVSAFFTLIVQKATRIRVR